MVLKGHSFSCAVKALPSLGALAPEGGRTLRIPSAAKADGSLQRRTARLKPCPFKTAPINLVTCAWLGLAIFALSSFAAAQNITGSVTNATTGKPSVGDEVKLLSLSQGM